MTENLDNVKITYAKNINKLNFNTLISVGIDSNVNIKTILNINSYIYDINVECGAGKAIVNGRIGVKVLYIDIDNNTNTINDSVSFSETLIDATITNNSYIVFTNVDINNNVISADTNLKINFECNLTPVIYFNLALPNMSNNFENMMIKRSQIDTSTISTFIDQKFEHSVTLETKDQINKILVCNTYFNQTNTNCIDDCALIEGKLFVTLLYEYTDNEETKMKEITECFNIKKEVSIPGINQENTLDIVCRLNKSKENITTEMEDNNTIIMISNEICISGISTKKITLDMIDDMYSIDNEINLTTATREYNKNIEKYCLNQNINGEISLTENESAIEEIICNECINAEITNYYIKDENLYLEGIVCSRLVYLDENKEYMAKQTELPFIINTQISLSKIDCLNANISILDCKTKSKRGTNIEFEYDTNIYLCIYSRDNVDLIDNFVIGKELDFSNIDFQIFLAKQDETMWELAKRIKINPEELLKLNPNLPTVMLGGEKVIIKR